MEEYGFVHVATVDVSKLDEALAKLAKKKIEAKVKEQPGSARPGVGSIVSSKRLIFVPEAELLRARAALGLSKKTKLSPLVKILIFLFAMSALAASYYLYLNYFAKQ